MKIQLLGIVLVLACTSCAGGNHDMEADAGLGLTQQEDLQETQKALSDIQRQQIAEQKKALERQIAEQQF